MKFRKTIVVFFMISVLFCYGESDGEKLFKINNPSGAVPLLEKEISEGKISSDTFNFLGLAYFQLGDYAKSIDAFERGMKVPTSSRKVLAFNEGNVAYVSGDYNKAENCFSLALAASPEYSAAVLNRANSRLMKRSYKDAVVDYKKFLEMEPFDSQNEEIRRLIAYLEEEIVFQEQEEIRLAEEKKRQEEENARIQAELAKQQAEREALEAAKRAEEEERRRKLLEEVANSLQQTDTTNMTAGAEDVLDYEYESELE